MVAVAKDHIPQLSELLFVYAQLAVLVDHQNPEFVAKVEHCGGGGIVGAAHGIEAVFLKLQKAVAPEFVRHGDAYSCMVQVQVASLQLHALSVKEKSLLRIEPDGPQAEPAAVLSREAAVVI